MLGIIFSFSNSFTHHKIKKSALIFTILGFLAGVTLLCVRLYDPKGMNLFLMAFNRKLVVTVAGLGVLAVLMTLINFVIDKKFLRLANLFSLSVLIFAALSYLVPPILQYTREFIYFGEAGISTNAMLRALGFTLGIFVCLLISLSAYEVHKSLRNDK
ncbi:MAG: DUF2318 domain-containing protein, partial [Synergistales bacterium]|nr:DUF2318 domain-containing protein [Synergistales bacterium]